MTNQELLKVYSSYLPYGVRVTWSAAYGLVKNVFLDIDSSDNLYESRGEVKYISINECLEMEYKPILRPLSDLTKEIEHNGKKFVPIEWLEDKFYTLTLHEQCKNIIEDERWINSCDYMLIQYLLEWHFDVFGLLDKNLAINLNEVK